MKIKGEVSQEDIDKGFEFDCARCPVTLSVTRSLVEAGHASSRVLSDQRSVQARIDGSTMRAISPQNIARFISDFDDGVDVTPIAWELEFTH